MATPTSRRAPAASALTKERGDLCVELIEIERKKAPLDTRSAAIEARLKQIADESQESFTVTVADGSHVRVSPPVAAEFKGDVPVIQSEAWLALQPRDQKRHQKEWPGLVKVEPQWGRASGGRVQVKVY